MIWHLFHYLKEIIKTRFDENWLYLHKIENTSMYESLKQATDQEAIDF